MIVDLNPVTPSHHKLWHREFVMLAVAGMLLTTSAYMLLALIPLHMAGRMAAAPLVYNEQMLSAAVYALGLFAPGPFCNWLTQRYRRGIVCVRAMEGYVVCALASWIVLNNTAVASPWLVEALRFATAAFYGLAVLVLFGTLVIDKTESPLRTQGNHTAAWLARLGTALGPLFGILLYRNTCAADVCLWAAVCGMAAAVLVRFVNMPFKAPDDDVHHISADRFMLSGAWRLFFFTAMCFACYGYVLSVACSSAFYALVLVGYLWALVSEHFTGSFCHSRTDLFVAFFFVLSAMSVFCSPDGMLPGYLTPCLLGAGVGMTGARAQLMFISGSDHCRRGTAVCTFFLACEWGVAIGVLVGMALH